MKSIFLVLIALSLASCAFSDKPRFSKLTPNELADYNASLAAADQVHCIEIHINGTQRMTRTSCGTEKQLALRGTGFPARSDMNTYEHAIAPTFRSQQRLPIISFSPPPPGYDRPVIHVRDPRR